MTDLGLLSHQYQELATLARRLRLETALIKVSYHRLMGAENAQAQRDLGEAIKELSRIAEFLKDVVDVNDEGEWPQLWLASPPVPSVIVERLRQVHENDRPLYMEKLGHLKQHLDQSVQALNDQDMVLIDEIVLAANADASLVFRRLMRWR